MIQQRDAFEWSVIYEDGSVLQEFDEMRPGGRGWAEIGESVVSAVLLTMPEIGKSHRVAVPAGATPVFFRRRTITLHPIDEQGNGQRSTIHCIGWKTEHDAVYLFVFESGEILLTNELQAV